MGSIGSFFSAILAPLEWVVATIMVAFHTAFTAVGLPSASGLTWALSIVGLVIVIRIILIPLFVKQIKASRGLQLIQPEVQKIQKKYKGKTDPASRQAMTQETMALYKESGTNPFASCLPILLQSPVFFALYRVLRNIAQPDPHAIGPFSLTLIHQADRATLFGARISDKFIGAETLSTQILTITLIVLMSASTFTTQRQLMQKNMPAAALDNPFAKQQKMLMYVLPLFFAISGVNFPIGVLLYWLTTNVWSMGQQFYVIRRMPAPGSQAEKDLEARRARKAKDKPIGPGEPDGTDTPEPPPPPTQRQQPKRNQPRKKRGPKQPGAAGSSNQPRAGEPNRRRGPDNESNDADPGSARAG
ncbi:MAG: membrane protein insertase YidC [Actinomycetota bacterium]|nr:membrane protein insertase YidC [Actinomycetota bacterium]